MSTSHVIGNREVEVMARALIAQHLPGWTLGFDRATRRLGKCSYGTRSITLSRSLTTAITEREARETILHEIGHAIAGHSAAHGPAWAAAVRRIGGHPKRTYNPAAVAAVPHKWRSTCPSCGHTGTAHVRGKYACRRCCNRYNRGRFSEDFLLVWTPNR